MTFRRWPFSSSRPLRQTALTLGSAVLLTGTLITGAIALVRQLGWLQGSELAAYDWLLRLRPDDPPDERFLVVGITEEDIQQRQEYPVHDRTLADVLRTLKQYDPRAIAVDVARDVPQGAGREAFLQEVTSSDRVVVGCVLSSAAEPGVAPPPGVDPDQVGFADLPLDPRGIVRRSILISTPAATDDPVPTRHRCNQVDPDNQLLSLGLLLALIYLEDEGITAQQTQTGLLQLGDVVIPRLTPNAAGYHQNGATDYQVMLNYRAADKAIRSVSLSEVLNGEIDPSWVEDRVVLIGYLSTIANDHFLTPYSGNPEAALGTPGVFIHAQSASQLVSAVLDGRPLIGYGSPPVETLWIWAWSLVGGTIGFGIHRTDRFLVLLAIALGGLMVICYWLFLAGGWVPLSPPLLSLSMTAIAAVLIDRANQFGYSQAFYERTRLAVRHFIPLELKINEAEKAQQVEEITSTSFFQDLKQRAKEIRKQRAALEQSESTTADATDPPADADRDVD